VPELYPTELGGIGDQPFFGGAVIRPVTSFVLRKGGDGWEVDAGRAHGMPSVVDKDPVIFAVPSAGGGGTQPFLRVTEIRIDRSLVQPLGWHPDEDRQYPVVVASVPMP